MVCNLVLVIYPNPTKRLPCPGMVGIPVWVPFLIGLTGTMMVNPMVLQVVGFPRNFLQHGSSGATNPRLGGTSLPDFWLAYQLALSIRFV